MSSFRAMVVREHASGRFEQCIEERQLDELPPGDVVIRVQYSCLNYKDALSATGNKAVSKHYPHTPGIDAFGVVESSQVEHIQQGDEVIVTGYDLGMNTAGGFGQMIRVPAGWVVKKPAGLTLKDAAALGKAGFTAALSVRKLLRMGLEPDQGDVLVTGATGGVGIVAVALLAKLGYSVIASTAKTDQAELLFRLGARKTVDRDFLTEQKPKALLPEQWSAVVDTVGGETLFTAIKSLRYGGSATTCGLVAGPQFAATVFPFILRGVNLLGVDSVELPLAEKTETWRLLANDWQLQDLSSLSHEVGLDELPAAVEKILQGKMVGRTIVVL